MKRWLWLGVALAAVLAAVGCGGGSTAVSITLSQTTATVFLQQSVQFVANVTGSTATPTWSVNGLTAATSTTPSGNSTVGTVDATGIYTAPVSLPVAGTTITVTAAVGSTSASVTITLDSGLRVSVTPSTYTIGTGEQYQFTATVSGLASDASLAGVCTAFGTTNPSGTLPLCNAVTWTVTGTNPGTIVASTGAYTAPTAATTASITATSVYDTAQAATVTATISAATNPTITSISPRNAAAGTLFQDVYVTGTNFISTTKVYVDNIALGASQSEVASINSSTTLRVRFLDLNLSSGTHTLSVSQQNGSQQACTTPALCQLTLAAVRPAIIGSPSVPQPSGAGAFDVDVDGGYYGSGTNPAVTAKVGGKSEALAVHNGVTAPNKDRQLSVTINAADVSLPGSYPLELDSVTAGVPPTIVNLAVQPTFSTPPSQLVSLGVGTAPAAVAVNAATGIAVVANQGTNDITLIDMTQSPPATVGFICTGAVGQGLSPAETNACPAAGPTAVAIGNIGTRSMALVANAGSSTVAAVDLTPSAQKVDFVLPSPTFNPGAPNAVVLTPAGIGINSATARALIAYRSTNVASILDLSAWPAQPAVVGVVNISNGLKAHVAVSQKLNWALITPGQLGSLSIVDLNRQNIATIATAQSGGAIRVAGTVSSTVTITTTAAHALQVGEPVFIQGVSDPSFNGYYTVASVPSSNTFMYAQSPSLQGVTSGAGGGTANYASALASIATSLTVQGVAVNDETQQALLVDPVGGTPVQVLSLLDQSLNAITLPTTPSNEQSNSVAAAFNPLADIGITVNNITGNATLVDPAHQTLLSANPFAVGSHPVDVAIDPVTNEAIFVNQGSNTAQPGTVSIFSLGVLRAGPQIVEVSAQPVTPMAALPGPAVIDGPAVIVGSTLTTGVNQSGSVTAVPQTLTITGGGFTGNSKVRLDGTPLAASSASANGRQITAQVPASMQLSPHRYALDVVDSSSFSNASSFTVIQRVDLTQSCAPSLPLPQGVAIDDTNNLVVVTEPGCNKVAIIDLATGTAQSAGSATVAVGSGPGGVAVLPSAGLAVVANLGSGSASIVDEIGGQGVVGTATTDQSPIGVAVDQGTGNALVAASGANVLDVFSVSSTPGTPTTNAVGQGPIGVAVDPSTHLAGISNSSAGTVSLVDLTGATGTSTASGFSLPEGVALNPCLVTSSQTGDCASSGFIVASSTGNLIDSVNPATSTVTPIRVGINPTSVAYNFNSSTVVTTNPQSQTVSVLDFLDFTVRAVFSATPSSLFGLAIHPATNLAVLADTVNNQLLLVPLPR